MMVRKQLYRVDSRADAFTTAMGGKQGKRGKGRKGRTGRKGEKEEREKRKKGRKRERGKGRKGERGKGGKGEKGGRGAVSKGCLLVHGERDRAEESRGRRAQALVLSSHSGPRTSAK
jgi:hypothetical protein